MSNRFDYGGTSFDLAVQEEEVFSSCNAIHEFKRNVLKIIPEANRHGSVLWSVTPTFPETARPEFLFPQAYLFADLVARRDYGGAWLCAHTREKTRKSPFGFHFSGLVLYPRPRRLVSAWTFRSGASPSATCVHLLGGQDVPERLAGYKCPNKHLRTRKDGRLVDFDEACEGKTLRENLASVLTYAMKQDPRLDVYPLRSRIVASGVLGDILVPPP